MPRVRLINADAPMDVPESWEADEAFTSWSDTDKKEAIDVLLNTRMTQPEVASVLGISIRILKRSKKTRVKRSLASQTSRATSSQDEQLVEKKLKVDGGACEDPEEMSMQAKILELVAHAPVASMVLAEFHSPGLPECLFEHGLEASLTTLDLSRNELKELPSAIGSLSLLTTLNVSRNFIKKLPPELGQLKHLETLDASSNDLRPKALSLEALAALPLLRHLDLRFNNHIWEPAHEALLARSLAGVTCPMTLREPKEKKQHAADRDPSLLRSQLEPLCTGTLRRRLALVFVDTTDPEEVQREEVMARLLAGYARSGPRAVRRVRGRRVSDGTCDALLAAMVAWAREDEKRTVPRERLTINAAHYMILTSPKGFTAAAGAKAARAREKLAGHATMWELARRAVEEVDPDFAARYTAVAFTKNFVGSPHIDTQNIATFRGLALGDFSEGGGALAVEVSAREVAHVDTRRRLGKLDGRFPHW